ncbi:unnamed protein product, partial [Ilex paraguariensis]
MALEGPAFTARRAEFEGTCRNANGWGPRGEFFKVADAFVFGPMCMTTVLMSIDPTNFPYETWRLST